MPDATLSTDGALWRALQSHLLEGEVEQVAFLLAELRTMDPPELRLQAISPVDAKDFSYQGAFHVRLKDGIRSRMIKWAWDEGGCLVEAHSHRDGPAAFSPTDFEGLDEFVPHIWWRLQRPYAALVLAPGTFDGLAWMSGPDRPVGVKRVVLDGSMHELTATGLSRA